MYRPYLAFNTMLSLLYESIHGSLNGRGKLGLYYNRILGYITWILWSCNECCGTLLLLPFYFAWAGWSLFLSIYLSQTINEKIIWSLFASIPLTITLLIKGFSVMKNNVSRHPKCREPAPKYNKLIHRLELFFRFKITRKYYLHISVGDACLHFNGERKYPNLFCNTDDNHYEYIYYQKTTKREDTLVIDDKMKLRIQQSRDIHTEICRAIHPDNTLEISYNNYKFKDKRYK